MRNSNLQSKKLIERSFKIVKEAKARLEDINGFELKLEKISIILRRKTALENVDQVFEKVMRKVNKENENIIQFPSSNVNKDVWVCAAHSKELKYFLVAAKMWKKTAWLIASDFYKKDIIHLPVEDFKKTVRKLITLIQDGKHDEHIHLTAEQLIYDKMLQRFKYRIHKMKASINRLKYKKVPKERKIPEYTAVRKDKKVPKERKIKFH
jgi:hypothetical protein